MIFLILRCHLHTGWICEILPAGIGRLEVVEKARGFWIIGFWIFPRFCMYRTSSSIVWSDCQ